MAANIELASIYLTGNKEAAEQNFYAETWFKGAKKWYVRAIELLPRNVILFTDVARFYRERAKMLLEKGEDESVYYARGPRRRVHQASVGFLA